MFMPTEEGGESMLALAYIKGTSQPKISHSADCYFPCDLLAKDICSSPNLADAMMIFA